jgi:hypothetical protein
MKIRTLIAVALLAPAAAFAAPKSTSAEPSSSGLELGGFVGYESDDLSGLALRLDGELPFQNLSPQVKLSFVGSIGYSHLSWEEFGFTVTSNLWKIVPAARFTIPVAPQFDVFGDVGLGLAHASISAPGFSSSSTNLMMRFGAGGWYHVNPQIKLGAMIDLDPIFGNYGTDNAYSKSQTFWNLLVGAMFAL